MLSHCVSPPFVYFQYLLYLTYYEMQTIRILKSVIAKAIAQVMACHH